MGEIVWVDQGDGKKRLAIELRFGLVKHLFLVVEGPVMLRRPLPKVEFQPISDTALDDITYYLTNDGLWIKQWYYDDEMGPANEGWKLAHPVEVALDYLWAGREPHGSIGAEWVEIARDYERYLAWCKGTEHRAWRAGLPTTALSGPGQGSAPPGVSTGGGQTAATGGEQDHAPARPRWDRVNRELFFGNVLFHRFPERAENQMALLDAFEAAGWPERTANNHFDNENILNQTIKNIKKIIKQLQIIVHFALSKLT